MKNWILTILILTTWAKFSTGQNLVPNYSFEVQDTCPYDVGQIYLAQPWFSPTASTPDLFNPCSFFGVPSNFFGYENAKLGSSYAGLITMFNYYQDPYFLNYREYIEVSLDSALQNGVIYYVSFYLSLADSVNYGTSNIGAYFSIDTLKSDTTLLNLSVTPQVENPSTIFLTTKNGWIKVYGQFIASGGEKFMTIGNFRDFNNTDTILVAGGSTNIWQSDWYTGYYYIDNVSVSRDSTIGWQLLGLNEVNLSNSFRIYPNPTIQIATIEFDDISTQNCSLTFFDYSGQTVKTFENIEGNKSELDLRGIPVGFYFYRLITDKNSVVTGKLIIE
jgi:hypothetical protein